MSDPTWDIPFHKACFKTSHNSFEMSIIEQLDFGLRALEYDVHDDKIQDIGDFEVYHLENDIDEGLNKGGNPSDLLLTSWLNLINDWSNQQKREHAPITIFIELKNSIIDENNQPDELYGIKKLNDVIVNSFSKDKIFTHKKFRENNSRWPTIREMKNQVLLVLTSYWGGYWAASEGGFESRLKNLKNCLEGKDDICFVAWIEEDKGNEVSFMRENAPFWKCSIEYSTKHFEANIEAQRLTRVDFDKIIMGRHVKTYYKKNYNAGFRCNFPSTDEWANKKYHDTFPWSI